MLRPATFPASSRLAACALLLAATAGCSLFGEDGPVRVAAIGALHRAPDRAASPLSFPDRLLLDATAQGLVAFSADGQVEAGLAERWTVIDGGRSYIFRLRDAHWANGRPVRAADVADALKRKIASPRLRTMLRGEFAAVRDIRAMTNKVIEISLAHPQPDLLDLLAQPDMAITRNDLGWGPWRAAWAGGTALLTPVPFPNSSSGDANGAGASGELAALLWGSSGSRALAQFEAGDADLVFGGRFETWPLIAAAGIERDRILADPADGLFGLAVVSDEGLLADEPGRNAVAMAIDRAGIASALNIPGWETRVTVRAPVSGPDGIALIYPGWVDLSPGQRRVQAASIVRAWRARNGDHVPTLRIALPPGPGARILYARLHKDLGAIGVATRLVALGDNADLRLLDEVAPSGDPVWYLRRLSCERGLSCADAMPALLTALTEAGDDDSRLRAFAAAEEAVTRQAGFIPIGEPVRWSLARAPSPGLRANIRARHSLIRLRNTPD